MIFFIFSVCGLDFICYICRKLHINQQKETSRKFRIMNKTDLIKKISAAGLNQTDAKKALDATLDAIKEALVAGDKVQLVGFGTFSVAERAARKGINPSSGAAIDIAAKKLAKFKAGADLDKELNA